MIYDISSILIFSIGIHISIISINKVRIYLNGDINQDGNHHEQIFSLVDYSKPQQFIASSYYFNHLKEHALLITR